VIEPGADGRLMAEIPAQMQHRDVRIALGQVVEHLGSGIAAAVIDEDQLVLDVQAGQRPRQPEMQLAQVFLLVVQGYDDTQLWRRRHR